MDWKALAKTVAAVAVGAVLMGLLMYIIVVGGGGL